MSELVERLLGAKPAEALAPSERIVAIRDGAAKRLRAAGLPDRGREDWKYTPLKRLAEVALDGDAGTAAATGALAREPTAGLSGKVSAAGCPDVSTEGLGLCEGALRLLLVDGELRTDLAAAKLPAGLTVRPLREALAEGLEEEPALVDTTTLGSLAGREVGPDPLSELNLAHLGAGLLLEVAEGTRVEVPVELLFVGGGANVSHPRVVVRVREGGELTLVETWRSREPIDATVGSSSSAGPGADANAVAAAGAPGRPALDLHNGVTQLHLEANARLTHCRLQLEADDVLHVGNVRVEVARDATYRAHTLGLGGALGRLGLQVHLRGPGAETHLDGLFVAAGKQHLDHQLYIDHAAPHCTSRTLFKGISGGLAHAVFGGRVVVQKDAQKTDAGLSNPNLLLSRGAELDTRPQMEIFADDVKATHGSTVGRLDEEALFFLRARGIGADEAQRLLTWGFAREVVERMPEPLRAGCEKALERQLQELTR